MRATVKFISCPNCGLSLSSGEEVYFGGDGEICCCTYCVRDFYDDGFYVWEKSMPRESAGSVIYEQNYEREKNRDYERSV